MKWTHKVNTQSEHTESEHQVNTTCVRYTFMRHTSDARQILCRSLSTRPNVARDPPANSERLPILWTGKPSVFLIRFVCACRAHVRPPHTLGQFDWKSSRKTTRRHLNFKMMNSDPSSAALWSLGELLWWSFSSRIFLHTYHTVRFAMVSRENTFGSALSTVRSSEHSARQNGQHAVWSVQRS